MSIFGLDAEKLKAVERNLIKLNECLFSDSPIFTTFYYVRRGKI